MKHLALPGMRQLQQLFLTTREIAGKLVAQVMELHALQNLLSALAQGLFLGVDLVWMQPGIEEVFPLLLLWDEEKILQHRHALERPGDLKCANNLARKNGVGWESIDPFSLEPYAPSIRPVYAGNHVKQRGFPSTIGANQPGNRATSNAQRAAIYCHYPAETLCDVVDGQEALLVPMGRCRRRHRHLPVS